MELGSIYTITLGKNADKYMCVGTSPSKESARFKRVRLPKTKIDAVRLPEIITITLFGNTMPHQITKKKNNQLNK